MERILFGRMDDFERFLAKARETRTENLYYTRKNNTLTAWIFSSVKLKWHGELDKKEADEIENKLKSAGFDRLTWEYEELGK